MHYAHYTRQKEKVKTTSKYQGYILKYSGVEILISDRCEKNIDEIYYINQRIMRRVLNLNNNDQLNIISVHVSHSSKSIKKIRAFYRHLQNEIDKMNIWLGSNKMIATQRFNEPMMNEKGESLIKLIDKLLRLQGS